MDNASKALIIAGAILISVALVSLGVYLYSIGADAANKSITQINVLDMQMQNGNIQKFVGPKVKGSEVRQLIDYINAVNAAKAMPDDILVNGFVTSEENDGSTSYTISDTLRSAAVYKVEASETKVKDGYIDTITISAIPNA